VARRDEPVGVRDGYLRGALPQSPTPRQVDVLAAFVAAGESVSQAAALLGIRPSTAKRHLADLRARSGLTTKQLIYRGRAEGWLVVPSLEPSHLTQVHRPGRRSLEHPVESSDGCDGRRHIGSCRPSERRLDLMNRLMFSKSTDVSTAPVPRRGRGASGR